MTYEELNKQINVMKAEIEHKSVQLAALRIAEIEDAILMIIGQSALPFILDGINQLF